MREIAKFALWHYYSKREKAKSTALDYKEMFKDDVADLIGRDSKSVSSVFESQAEVSPVNPNLDPFSIEIS